MHETINRTRHNVGKVYDQQMYVTILGNRSCTKIKLLHFIQIKFDHKLKRQSVFPQASPMGERYESEKMI